MNRMINKQSLVDPLAGRNHEYGGIWFTWCNYQQGSKKIYNRLDRFYFNKSVFNEISGPNNVNVKTIPYTLSDHHPISISIHPLLSPITNRRPSDLFALNVALLKDECVTHVAFLIKEYNAWFPSFECY